MAAPEGETLLFLRDVNDVEPPRDRYRHYDEEDIYRLVPKPLWTGMEEELWSPRANEHDPQLEKMKQMIKRNSQSSNGAGAASPGGIGALAAGALSSTAQATKFASKLVRKKRRNKRLKVKAFLNHKLTEGFLMFITFWSLFTEDIRVLGVSRDADIPIYWCHLVVMCIFLSEVIARSYAQRGYWSGCRGFYFWLDTLASVTMVFDIIPLIQPQDESSMDFNYAKLGKSARVGTRLTRLMRILRVLRVLKLMLSSSKKKADADQTKDEDYKPSELGKELQERISRKVIIFTLSLLGGTVLLDTPYVVVTDERAMLTTLQTYFSITDFSMAGVNETNYMWNRLQLEKNIAIEDYEIESYLWTKMNLEVFRFSVYNTTPNDPNITYYLPTTDEERASGQYDWPYPDTQWTSCELVSDRDLGLCPPRIKPLRNAVELLALVFYDCVEIDGRDCSDAPPKGDIWYSKRKFEIVSSVFSISLTCSIAALLGLMAYLFSRDADTMVIRPIESMVDSVTKLAANPAHKLERVKKVRYETDALKMSLGKIAAMLQVGFGEAGNNLVAENLKKGDTVDPMVPGKKLLGAYGFCIIDDYEEVLECLGEEILPFTNTAATIVHKAVTDNFGLPNRNLGDAFLCVWKPTFAHGDEMMQSPQELAAAEMKMCDGALTAFRQCVRAISMSSELQAYNSNEEILKFFDGQYTTVVGYGLHYGWAIEGAVGTNIKIDCSYLSPNVNLAARLESATKMYGVTILMSEFFAGRLSKEVRQGLRRVDVVCLKGSSIPMAIYTCDRSNGIYCATAAIERYSADKVVNAFQEVFEKGMDMFVEGKWDVAKTCFEEALWICPRDKPSKRILMHMDTAEGQPDYGLATIPYVAPEGWPGYHILASK